MISNFQSFQGIHPDVLHRIKIMISNHFAYDCKLLYHSLTPLQELYAFVCNKKLYLKKYMKRLCFLMITFIDYSRSKYI